MAEVAGEPVKRRRTGTRSAKIISQQFVDLMEKKQTSRRPKRSRYKRDTTTIPPIIETGDFHRKVEAKAYELYVNRGFTAGDPAADWFEAEKLVKAELVGSAA